MKPVIPNVIFIVLIVLTTLCLTFLTAKGGLTNNKFKGFLRKITSRGKLVFFTSIFMLLILIAQDYNNSNLAKNGEFLLKKERYQRDSLITGGIKKGVDDSRKRLFEDVSKAFAKQGLRIDTLNKSIETFKTLKTTTNILPVEKDPILRVIMADKGIYLTEGSSPHFRLHFRSDDAGSTNFNIKTYVLIIFNNDEYILEEPSLFEKYTKLSSTSLAMLPISKTTKNVKYLYFYITGTYSNLSMSKNYNINEVYRYQSDTKETWGVVYDQKKNIIDGINKILKKN